MTINVLFQSRGAANKNIQQTNVIRDITGINNVK